jgi:hypothetical protein
MVVALRRLLLAAIVCLAWAPQLAGAHSVARLWNEQNLAAIRIDVPNPPVHARNLFHTAVAMYDAWAAYDATAFGYFHHERATAPDVPAARREAISYAAYRILTARYAASPNAAATMTALAGQMAALGYDPAVVQTVGPSPAALGNRIAAAILAWGLADGSGEAAGYQDPAYSNPQPPLPVIENGIPLGGIPAGTDPDLWQPLWFDEGFNQNGTGSVTVQPFVGVTWLRTRPFSLRREEASRPWFDPGGPAFLRSGGAAQYRQEAVELLHRSGQLADATVIDISPGASGNNPLGTEQGAGHPLNPATGQPYAPRLVPRGDYARVIAEFWADGPESETPPGHWHVLANEVSDALSLKRIGGTGPALDALEWDVKLYFALAGATHDAACAAWSLKRYYQSPRPITMIRFMASRGQSSDPGQPSYHPEGLPLVPGLSEVVTAASLAPGGVHAGLGFAPGDVVVFTWPGAPEDPTVQRSPARWILGTHWLPYQRKDFVSPAFPGYLSGHSTFSRAAAEILTAITGSAFFPGGLGTFTAMGGYLRFEYGPSVPVQLQWATYYDAADEAGASRRWGGIHPTMDDLPGRVIGAQCARQAWQLAQSYWDGTIVQRVTVPRLRRTAPASVELAWDSAPGLWYRIFRTSDFVSWDGVAGPIQALEPRTTWTDPTANQPRLFYRIVQQAAP